MVERSAQGGPGMGNTVLQHFRVRLAATHRPVVVGDSDGTVVADSDHSVPPPDRATAPPIADAGMSTVEYAVGTVVAAAFAAVLYKIVTGDSVIAGLTNLINTALNTTF